MVLPEKVESNDADMSADVEIIEDENFEDETGLEVFEEVF